MKKMTKAHWAGIGRFVEEVRKVLESRGIAVAVEEPFDPKRVDSRFALKAVAMTKFGRLDITVYDWIATRFDLPKEASKEVDCNPHSGKWNLHFHTEDFSAKPPTEMDGHDPVKECADLLAWRLDRVEAREWTTAIVPVSAEEVDARSKEYWKHHRGMGKNILIEDFDFEGAKEYLATHWTDNDGNVTEQSENMNRAWLSHADHIDVHFYLKSWTERAPAAGIPDFYDNSREMTF